jgi:hypothetical protein
MSGAGDAGAAGGIGCLAGAVDVECDGGTGADGASACETSGSCVNDNSGS